MLVQLAELDDARVSDLAEAAGVDLSTASRTIARLVSAGHVDKSPDPTDGRATVHRLTPDGRRTVDRLVAARNQWLDELLDDFSPTERAALAGLLSRFVGRIHDLSRTGSPAR